LSFTELGRVPNPGCARRDAASAESHLVSLGQLDRSDALSDVDRTVGRDRLNTPPHGREAALGFGFAPADERAGEPILDLGRDAIDIEPAFRQKCSCIVDLMNAPGLDFDVRKPGRSQPGRIVPARFPGRVLPAMIEQCLGVGHRFSGARSSDRERHP
jgi:hypothetical protein